MHLCPILLLFVVEDEPAPANLTASFETHDMAYNETISGS